MTKLYVASSWRNQRQPLLVRMLRGEGFEVYDFRDSDGFQWGQIDPNWESWTAEQYAAALDHPLAVAGFRRDMAALAECDACVLLMPCGISAHLELGWAVGAGKPSVVLLSDGEPELMRKMASAVVHDVEGLLYWIKRRFSEEPGK